jgi:L-fucose isomerase-like protein
MRKPKVAFVGFGEVNTPREIIEGKCKAAVQALQKLDLDLIITPPVSDDPKGKTAARAIRQLHNKQFDLLIVCLAGWIPSQAVIRVANEFAHIPMVLWGLAGHTKNGTLYTTADQAGTTALRQVMADMGYCFKYVYDFPGKPSKTDQIEDFARAALARNELKHSKVGMMGCRDMKLYGTMYDTISLRTKVGPEV